jgi:endonuclease YncB( thermonuclease family)
MILRVKLAVIGAVLLCLGACQAAEVITIKTALVQFVFDGDSFRALVDGQQHELRLWGIDAPERHQTYADQSKKALRELIQGQRISIDVVAIDDYERLVVRATKGNLQINRSMIEHGHAWWFKRYARHATDYAEAEQSARSNKRGLWQAPKPQAPWNWRAEQREQAEE